MWHFGMSNLNISFKDYVQEELQRIFMILTNSLVGIELTERSASGRMLMLAFQLT